MPKFDPTNVVLSDTVPMADNSSIGVTSHAAYIADTAVLAAAQRKAWVTGVLKPNSFVYYSKANTVSGTVTFYLTDDGTSSGNAVFTDVYADTCSQVAVQSTRTVVIICKV